MTAALKVAGNVRDACVKAAAEAYEYGGIQGLCAEGRWELARRAIEEIDLQKIVSDSMPSDGKPHAVSEEFDLDAYLSRIQFSGDLSPSRAVLEALHLAHVTHIPFENLDVLLGRRIHLDEASLQAKLVRARRGGYCFEQNLLFSTALEKIGFSVTPLAARVRFGTDQILPRTHMLMKTEAEGDAFIADVGFGGEGLLLPIPFVEDRPFRQFARTFRLLKKGPLRVLQSLHEDQWIDLYAFTLEPQKRIDFEMANWYTSTYPGSRFAEMLIVQKTTPGERIFLHGRELTVDSEKKRKTRRLSGHREVLRVLAETFGLHFAEGTEFLSDL